MQTGYRILKSLPEVLRRADFKVTATVGRRAGVLEVMLVEPGDTSRRNFGVAVDVGTTTVVVHLVDLTTGETLAAEATYNSQMRYGEDYIQRIIYAEEHDAFDEMQRLVVEDINGLIEEAARSAGVRVQDIFAVMIENAYMSKTFFTPQDCRKFVFNYTKKLVEEIRKYGILCYRT